MDVVMPGRTASSSTRAITRDPRFVERAGDHVHEQEPGDRQGLGHAPGRRDYIVKPVDADELVAKIKLRLTPRGCSRLATWTHRAMANKEALRELQSACRASCRRRARRTRQVVARGRVQLARLPVSR
jgi:DNA-binding response OmpR family regulator